MSYDAKRWYVARCRCMRPIIYQEGRGDYPLRCARCGGHLYTEPRPFQFEQLSRTPIVDMGVILRLLGLGVLAVLVWLWMVLLFMALGGP
jgi:hypothetical protein